MDTLKSLLRKNAYTTTSALRQLSLLRQVLEQVVFVEGASGTVVERYQTALSKLPSEERHQLEGYGTDFLSTFAVGTIAKTVAELRQWVDDCPTLILYVPVEFDDDHLTAIGEWCRHEIHNDIFLEIVIEPSVVGGCAFIYNNQYHDLSLRAHLHERPEVIPSIIATYESN
jgi:hypothetical protein